VWATTSRKSRLTMGGTPCNIGRGLPQKTVTCKIAVLEKISKLGEYFTGTREREKIGAVKFENWSLSSVLAPGVWGGIP